MLYATFEDYIRQHNASFDLEFDGLETIVASFAEIHKSDEVIRRHLKNKRVHLLDHALDCHQRTFLQDMEHKLDFTCIYDKPSRWDLVWWIWTFWQLGFWLTLAVIKRGRIRLKDLL